VRLALCCAAPKRHGNSSSAQTTSNFTRAIILWNDIFIAPVAYSIYIVISVFTQTRVTAIMLGNQVPIFKPGRGNKSPGLRIVFGLLKKCLAF
jgi:hypothetical protein